MSEKNIQTKTVSRDVAKASPFRLSETTNTRVGFIPTLHPGGINGNLVKYKKTSAKEWDDVKDPDFKSHSLASWEKVTIQLDTKAIKILIDNLKKLETIVEKGIQDGQKNYVVAEEGKSIIVDDQNKLLVLKQILDGGHSDEYWNLIAESQPNLAAKLASGHIIQIRTKVIAELKQRLTENHPETKGPNSWQNWIFKNNWLFGVNYQSPIEKQKINLQGVMPDYLFPRIDGFVDLLEIKLPSEEVLIADASHPGSYRWNAGTSKSIGQVASYLTEIERQQSEIERYILRKLNRKVSMLKPRAYILIGNSECWETTKLEGLRKLNDYLHGIEVLTYQDLIHRGEASLVGTKSEFVQKVDEDEIPF